MGGAVNYVTSTAWGQKIYTLGSWFWPEDLVMTASGALTPCADQSELYPVGPSLLPDARASSPKCHIYMHLTLCDFRRAGRKIDGRGVWEIGNAGRRG